MQGSIIPLLKRIRRILGKRNGNFQNNAKTTFAQKVKIGKRKKKKKNSPSTQNTKLVSC